MILQTGIRETRSCLTIAACAAALSLTLAATVSAQERQGGAGPGAQGPGAGARFGGPGAAGGRFGGAGRGFGGAATNEPETRGLLTNTPDATDGYTLFAPLNSTTSYLIDLEGNVVREWESEMVPSAWIYMLDNGDVLRGGREPVTSGFSGGGQGGRFQRFTFDGELIWDYSLNNDLQLPHHDVAVLPNGNLLAVVWEAMTEDETRTVGRREAFIPDGGIWGDSVLELEPVGSDGARVVWEWHAKDHLVQDIDPDLPNYGNPADLPERIDINGDIVGQTAPQGSPAQDVFHINSVAYNEDLDQIILSAPTFNEIWVIDHSVSTAAAAGSGGDLLYRWGNPQAYGRGTAEDTKLGFQHDAKWIPGGFPGAGNIMVFSNRTPGVGTEVLELESPVNRRGRYQIEDGEAYGPADPVWAYSADDFSATYISGAVRLWSGDTLITSGPQGRLFEVDPDGNVVWDYWSPFDSNTDAEGAAPNPFAVFRAIRIPPDHPALAGQELAPL